MPCGGPRAFCPSCFPSFSRLAFCHFSRPLVSASCLLPRPMPPSWWVSLPKTQSSLLAGQREIVQISQDNKLSSHICYISSLCFEPVESSRSLILMPCLLPFTPPWDSPAGAQSVGWRTVLRGSCFRPTFYQRSVGKPPGPPVKSYGQLAPSSGFHH